jgi:Concanavalin A-like lectin/glucanases superfamily
MENFQQTENKSTTASLPRKFKLLPPPARRSRMLAGVCGLLVALTAPTAHAQTCKPPPPGLVAWWPLDETAGTAVADRTGQNPGTASAPIGSNPPKSVTGFVGNALNFYFQARVNVNPSTSLDFRNDKSFTIDAWIKGRASPIVGNLGPPSAKVGYLLHIANDGKLSLEIGNGTPVTTTWSGPTITSGVWTFVAVVVDRTNNTVTFYDGVGSTLSGPVGGGPPLTTGYNAGIGLPLYIGGCPGNPIGCDTVIDEVEIFNRALTQGEIQGIFNAGSAGKCVMKGMTWLHAISNAQTGTITVGCSGCDAYQGDTPCVQKLPLLCIYKPTPPFSLPAGVNNTNQYNQWSGGVVATTAPVAGNTFPHISISTTVPNPPDDANSYCALQFGSGWRVAEFHDGWGWNFQAYGGTVSAPTVPSTRFWVHINDQPAATCWKTP